MNKHEILLKNKEPFIYNGSVVLFNDSDGSEIRANSDTIFINAEEVIYIKLRDGSKDIDDIERVFKEYKNKMLAI